MAHHWLWACSKNAWLMALLFKVEIDYCQGEHLWKWVQATNLLKGLKIRWEDQADLIVPHEETFTILVDGTDFATWEPYHPMRNIDKGFASHKIHHAAIKYKIDLSVSTAQCIWINGPFCSDLQDITIFHNHGLKEKLLP